MSTCTITFKGKQFSESEFSEYYQKNQNKFSYSVFDGGSLYDFFKQNYSQEEFSIEGQSAENTIKQKETIRKIDETANIIPTNPSRNKITIDGKTYKHSQVKSYLDMQKVNDFLSAPFKGNRGRKVTIIRNIMTKVANDIINNTNKTLSEQYEYVNISLDELKNEENFKEAVAEFKMTSADFSKLVSEVSYQIKDIQKKNSGAKLYSGVSLIDKKSNIIANPDLMYVDAEGNIGVLNYNFIQGKELTVADRNRADIEIHNIFNVLKSYGFNKFKTMASPNIRMTGDKDLKLNFAFEKEAKFQHLYYTLLQFSTSEKINNLLQKVTAEINSVVNKEKDPVRKKEVLKSLYNIRESLLGQVDTVKLFTELENITDQIEGILENPKDIEHQFHNMRNKIALLKMAIQTLPEIEGDMEGRREEIESVLISKVVEAERALNDEYIKHFNTEKGLNLNKLHIATTFNDRFLRDMSSIRNEVVKYISNMIDKAEAITRKEYKDYKEKLKEHYEKLSKVASGKNMSIKDLYNLIINPKTNNLISEYNAEFFKKKSEIANNFFNYSPSEKEEAIAWLTKYFEPNTELYNERFRKKQLQLARDFSGIKNDEYRNKLRQEWEEANDPKLINGKPKNIRAWLGSGASFKNLKIKESLSKEALTEIRSEEYNKIMEIPELLNFYKFFISSNLMFNGMTGEYAGLNTIPNIPKSFGESNLNTLFSDAKDIGSRMFMAEQDYSEMKDAAGKVILKVPLAYTNNIDEKNKSLDLINSLHIHAYNVFNYKNKVEIEEGLLGLRAFVESDYYSEIQEDKLGNPLKETTQRLFKQNTGTDRTKVIIDKYIQARIYGKQYQDTKDFQIGEKVSALRVLSKLRRLQVIVKLGLSPLTGLVIGASDLMHTAIETTRGRLITGKTYRDSIRDIRKEKDRDLISYFESELYREDELRELTVVPFKKISLQNFLFMFMKYPGMLQGHILSNAVLRNFGLDKAGNIKNLKMLPKDTKSLYEGIEFKDNKALYNGEEISVDSYIQIRNLQRETIRKIKFNLSDGDLMLANTNTYVTLLTTFRNWIPKYVETRVRGAKFNPNTRQIEIGRYNVLANELLNNVLIENIKRLKGESVAEYRQERMEILFDKFIEKNGLINIDGNQRNELYEEFIAARAAENKAGLMELGLIALAIIIGFGLGYEDDDEVPNYKKFAFGRTLKRLSDRIFDELTFLLNPKSTQDLTKSAVPLISYLDDLSNVVKNGIEESYKELSGIEDKRDKTGFLHYTIKVTPLSAMAKLIKEYEDGEKEIKKLLEE